MHVSINVFDEYAVLATRKKFHERIKKAGEQSALKCED